MLNMNQSGDFLQKLKDHLKVLFQFDCADLDFGIYRIMNYKRKEIEKFIEDDLIRVVEKEFERYKVQNQKELLERIEEKRKEIRKLEKELGEKILKNGEIEEKFIDKPFAKEYLELKKQIEEIGVTESIQSQVFNDLYNFFSRYYEDGDFISKRRYSSKNYKYAIPYNGEEVKLYWANFDQYYIKTGEVFKDYEFNQKGWKFIFRTIFADVPAGNVKGNRRYFFLSSDEPVKISKNTPSANSPLSKGCQTKSDGVFADTPLQKGNTCLIKFEYRMLTDEDLKHYPVKTKEGKSKTSGITQDELNPILKDKILTFITLSEPKAILTEIQDEKTILEKHLYKYTRKITSDFFIHKDLKGFLERELDYFIKTEVLDIESFDTEKERYFDRHITRAKVVKNIGRKIIEFLSQIENFQKMLWEKKKFVLKTDYVITIDRVPEEFYKEILENKEQLKEWEELGFDYSPLSKGWQAKPDGVLKLPYNPALKEKARELRKAGNLSEVLLWNELKNKKMLGYDFTRQQVIGNYIVDFHCPKLNLVIEIDGESHNFKGDYDEQRDNYLKSLGLTVLHFNDLDIKKSLKDVLIQIEDWIKKNTPSANADTPFGKRGIKLPVDTKFFSQEFKERLLEKLGETGNIDDLLDGILIKSENWQALNLLLEKYKEKVQTIYIDPPFNLGTNADFLYKTDYKDSSWICMLENRLWLAKKILNDRGSIFVRCDYNGNMYVRLLMNGVFREENFRNEIIVKRGAPKSEMFKQFEGIKSLGVLYDNLYFFTKNAETRFVGLKKPVERREGYWSNFYDMKPSGDRPTMVYELLGLVSPKGYYWKWGKERALRAVENYKRYVKESRKTGETIDQFSQRTGIQDFVRREKTKILYYVHPKEETFIDNNWLDISGYSSGWGFKTENSEILLKRVIESTSNEGDLVMDFFLGSGTTTAVAHKLKRKWLGVEMGDHFETVVLPRMKKVLAYDKSGISKEKDVKEKYNEKTAGGFFKYHYLEQYEDTLHNIEFPQEERAEKMLELFDEEAKTEYLMKYMLKFETEGSPSLLNLEAFENPFEYKLKIISNEIPRQTSSDTPLQKGKGEEFPSYRGVSQRDGVFVNVDLVETFNYLIGLKIDRYKFLYDNTPSANADTPLQKGNGRKYVFVFGERNNRRTAIVWRPVKDIDLKKDKEIIDRELEKFNPDEIFINGDSFVKGYKPIESEFKALMGV